MNLGSYYSTKNKFDGRELTAESGSPFVKADMGSFDFEFGKQTSHTRGTIFQLHFTSRFSVIKRSPFVVEVNY